MNVRMDRSAWFFMRRTLVSLFLAVAITLPATIPLSPLLVQPAYADHNSMYVVCPDPITEGDTAHMRVSRPGYRIEELFAFTYIVEPMANGSDYQTYDGVKFENKTGENSIYVPVITKEDSNPEPNETFSIGFWAESVWHGCVITIVDDDSPEIESVVITSSPVRGLFYRYGESIDVTVTLNQEVGVEGVPLLSLYIGGEEGSAWRGAEYMSGSGSNALIFRYKVGAGDVDHDGLSVSAGATNDDRTPAYGFSGKIYAKGTKAPIDYSHVGISNASHHAVEGRPMADETRIASTPPDGWQAYRANQVIEASFKFNTAVEVDGNVHVDLAVGYEKDNWDEARREAHYLRGSGSETLVFGYTVRSGDMDRKGIMIAGALFDEGFKGDGTIKAKGTGFEVFPYFLGQDHLRNHKVDTKTPSVSSVTFESRPGNGDAYAVGETMTVAVALDEEVTVTGDPYLELDIGGAARKAVLVPDAPRSASAQDREFGDRLVFQYQIVDGDTDSDGVGISANSLKLNGGGIYDKAGNAAGLDHSTVAANASQKVGASS